MIRFDKSKHYTEIFSVDSGNRTRFIQDGVHFDATGEVVGDAAAITKAKKEEAVAKARAELAQREAELNAEAEALGIKLDVDTIRSEVEAKVRAEMEAKYRTELGTTGADKVSTTTASKTSVGQTLKAAFAKKPGIQADDSSAA